MAPSPAKARATALKTPARPTRPRGKAKPLLPSHIGTNELSALLGITDRRIQQLARDGTVKPDDRGSFPLVETVHAFIAYVRDVEQRKAASSASDRLKERKDEELQRKMARDDRKLIDLRRGL